MRAGGAAGNLPAEAEWRPSRFTFVGDLFSYAASEVGALKQDAVGDADEIEPDVGASTVR